MKTNENRVKSIVFNKLSSEVESTKSIVEVAFDRLKKLSHPHWYSSVSFEKRTRHLTKIDPNSQNSNSQSSEGFNFRIFDGQSLFESAVNFGDENDIEEVILELVEKVKKIGVAEPNTKVYSSPQWALRIKDHMAKELTDQIPDSPQSNQWVHFGTKMKSPLAIESSDRMKYAESVFNKLESFNLQLSDKSVAKNPDYRLCDVQININEFLFIDESVRMSQSLCRNRMVIALIKNSERIYNIVGGLGGGETLHLNESDISSLYKQFENLLNAENLTPGRYKLLMHPAVSGVFAHEAFGHSQEGDTWARGRSKAKELFESQISVGNQHATIINNPALFKNGEDGFGAWGSYFFDEEGWLAEEHCLVKGGVLQRPMTNMTSALRLGVDRTANGKREDWSHGIYTRQTNTYFTPGDKTFAELLSQVDYGFYARNAAGGMEDPKGMGIQVGVLYLEEIKNGQLTGKAFKGPNGGAVQMTGYVPDALNSIIDKSKIRAFTEEADGDVDPWNEVGGCGKYHKELVDAGCGGPYMLLDKVLLS